MIHVYQRNKNLCPDIDREIYEFIGEFETKIEADKKINQLAKNGAKREDFKVYPRELPVEAIEPKFRIKIR